MLVYISIANTLRMRPVEKSTRSCIFNENCKRTIPSIYESTCGSGAIAKDIEPPPQTHPYNRRTYSTVREHILQ